MMRALALFIYSRESGSQYEYSELAKCLKDQGDDGRVQLTAIEDMNMFVSGHQFQIFIQGAELPVETIRTVFVIDMGLPSLANVAYRMYCLDQLSESGAMVINSPESINTCRNKLATSLCLGIAGVPAIPTLAISDPSGIQPSAVGMKAPLIVKPISGSRGIGVQELPNDALQLRTLTDAISRRDILLVQPSVPKRESADIRVLVAGDRIVAGMRRYSKNVVTNIAQGGTAIAFNPSTQIQEIAINARRAVHATVCTVDILEDREGNIFVLEVNAFARWKGLQTVTESSIAGTLARFVMEL